MQKRVTRNPRKEEGQSQVLRNGQRERRKKVAGFVKGQHKQRLPNPKIKKGSESSISDDGK